MNALVHIEVTPPLVEINYQEAKTKLSQHLKQYHNTVVTPETLADSKKLATDINKQRQAMKKRLKEKVDKAGAPLKDLQEKVKELDGMWEEARQALLRQIAQHEDQTRETAQELLTALRSSLWEEYGVDHEFHRAEMDDLVQISSVTATGKNLTKAAKDKLTARVRDDKALQDKTRMRLLELENRSYKAGLGSPLTREHVASFLYSEDEVYESRLQKMLDTEVEREQEAKAKWERDQEQEAARKAANKSTTKPSEPAGTQAEEPAKVTATKPDVELSGKSDVQNISVVATFKTQVNPKVPDEKIKTELTKRLKESGITTLHNITIHRG